jgi:5,10-methylenetetrahydromethanopterin reductase
MTAEIWLSDGGRADEKTADAARRHEDEGWDGYSLGDSHNFAPDPYPLLGAAAAVTSTLKLGTWVTNPVTRHVAITAAAIGAVQTESAGRAYLGIARGDSPLAHLGLPPASPQDFERFLEQLQSYLRGEEVDHFAAPVSPGAPSRPLCGSNVLTEDGRPVGNWLHWMKDAPGKVPVDVAASGPKVIEIGARVADRITFAIGATPERLGWAMDIAREEMAAAGRNESEVGMGAAVQVVIAPTRAEGREMIAGAVASMARYAVMHGKVTGPVSPETEAALLEVHRNYNMKDHASDTATHQLAAEVIDTFAVAGPVDHCIERLRALVDCGLTKLLLFHGAFRVSDPSKQRESERLLMTEVMPALK